MSFYQLISCFLFCFFIQTSFSQVTPGTEMKEEEANMHTEFVAAMRELYKLDLGVEKEDRLLRAQGVMFSLMRNNEQLSLQIM